MPLCPTCRVAYLVDPPECETCQRRRRYGVVADAILDANVFSPYMDEARYYEALDALAELMIDRHRLLRQHHKELWEEQRGALLMRTYDGLAEGRQGDGR